MLKTDRIKRHNCDEGNALILLLFTRKLYNKHFLNTILHH